MFFIINIFTPLLYLPPLAKFFIRGFNINMNEISFKATKICSDTIKERQNNGHYRNKTVSFVKLSNTKRDKKTLKDLQDCWKGELNFSGAINVDYFYDNTKNKSIYLITKQEDNFRKLEPEKILGIAELIKNRKSYQIKYIQTRPDCIDNKNKRPYKKIGESLINNIIAITKDARIYLESLEEVVDFYKKFNFKVIKSNTALPLMLLIKNKKIFKS